MAVGFWFNIYGLWIITDRVRDKYKLTASRANSVLALKSLPLKPSADRYITSFIYYMTVGKTIFKSLVENFNIFVRIRLLLARNTTLM